MPVIRTIDPVTRLEGHLKVEVTIDVKNGVRQVVDAHATGTLFRGFETILTNRKAEDAPHITQRICGVCPVAHGMASVSALDQASGTVVPDNARIMRNLVLGSNFVQSHILHFYHLAVQDFVDGPNMPPWQPSWRSDKRIGAAATTALQNHYVTALTMRSKAHEMGAIFGGRLPHPPAFLPGGFTTVPKAAMVTRFKSYLAQLVPFIRDVYIPDVQQLGRAYSDYFRIGAGPGNLLAYGVFDLDSAGANRLLKRGRTVAKSSTIQALDVTAITESVRHSWYQNSGDGLNPANGVTEPVYPKAGAYSWLKAPRYLNQPYETGALARMWVNGDYRKGVSVMDRHAARAQEALKVATAMTDWVSQLRTGGPVYKAYTFPGGSDGIGLTEAARGALGHWVQLNGDTIAHYQVITPTCWNASPRDSSNRPGPIEAALIGTPVSNADEPVEVLRVVHSFDPCLSCAVHVARPNEDARVYALGHYVGV